MTITTAALATTELTADEARHLTEQIRVRLDFLLPLVKQAFEGRADRALGYESWQAYCTAELGDVRVPLGDRPAMVAELRNAGMSTRAIGAALGISKDTAARDLASVSSETDEQPARIASLDGRERPATRPTPTPGPAGAAHRPPADPGEAPEPVETPSTAPTGSGPTPAPVVDDSTAAPAAPPREPDPTPPPGSPATWTPEQHEANRLEVQRKQSIAAAERSAKALVLEVRGMVTTIIDGIDFGAPGILVSLADIDECRAALDRLEARVMA
jgi:DNA-binding NarL/FixJ family response regulator